MNKAKEISALWSQIKPQIGELVRLCHEVESHAEVTADAYQRGYKAGREAEKVRKPDLEQVRKEAYDDGYNAGYGRKIDASYQEGLSDAWEAARKIGSNSRCGLEKMGFKFEPQAVAYYPSWYVVQTHSASECIEKIRQYEQRQEEQIQVGDEVELKCGVSPAIYMQGTNDSDEIYLLFNDGSCGIHGRDEIECKTGRHFPEIAEVLRKMKEADNG